MTISDEAIEALMDKAHDSGFVLKRSLAHDWLEAAAPIIRAGALQAAAEEIDRLRVIGATPYAQCTDYESRAFWAFAEVKPEAWLRARAAAERGEG